MSTLQLVGAAILATLAGVLMGVIGGGGGGVYVILLTFALDLPVQKAIGTALALSTVTALAGVIGHWRNRNVERNYALYLSASAVLGAVAGAWLIRYIPPGLLKSMIVATFVLIGLTSLVRIRQREQGSMTVAAQKSGLLLPAGLVTGLVSGAFGLSGSAPLSSFLVSFAYLSPPLAVGTTLVVVLVTSLAGSAIYYQQQSINLVLVLILGTGSVVGAYWGAKINTIINKEVLAVTLAILALAFGIYLALHS
jgi:uncharacterized membrane protein YfcA